MSAAKGPEAPSPWFIWHAGLIGRGARVLDLACGRGRHAVAAAARGATVIGVDRDSLKLKAAGRLARRRGVQVEWLQADLSQDGLPAGRFDVVMVFNYLDRRRFTDFQDAVRPGGFLLAETFLEWQQDLGWGPNSAEHLLRSGELVELIEPFELILGREVLEVLDGRPRAVASVVARRPQE